MTVPAAAPEAAPSLAVYVHWPFCRSKCPYCDFNSHVAAALDQERWRRALVAEIDHAAGRLPGRRVASLFFGGGTPSLMPPATAAAVIDRIAGHWRLADDAEITLEANPTSAEAAAFADLARAGVNRLSLGVQALDDRALAFLGRQHDSRQALAAVDIARRSVPRVSFDLIYARPGQTVADWTAELERALDHAGRHLSVYQLTIEKGTPFFAAHRAGAFVLPDGDGAAALYDATREILEAAGLPAYEISNHAAPGEECRHNLACWRGEDYVGIGPGAHGRITVDGAVRATENRPLPDAWLAAVEAAGHGQRRDAALDSHDRAVELLMTGLRLTAGIERRQFERRAGMTLGQAVDEAALARLAAAGLVEIDDAGLRATRDGLRLLDGVLARLVRDRPPAQKAGPPNAVGAGSTISNERGATR